MPPNLLRNVLGRGDPQIGLLCNLASSYAIEVAAGAGFDWMLIDAEHSPADLENVLRQLQALAAYPTAPVVRVPWNEMVAIKRYLDIGVQSLLIPYVETPDQAGLAVRSTRYPPSGIRGVALATRASGFGRVPDYAPKAHEDIVVIAQLENQAGMDNLEAIAAVDGIDALLIGPSDLHAAFGHVGETTHPDVVALIDAAIERIVATGKIAGVFAPIEDLARRWIDLGARLVLVGTDIGILARGTDILAERFKRASGHG
ncbi:MAG: HpcH/HpaI aldolase/citrate lyase family protein [Acidimicrobiia bacterium]